MRPRAARSTSFSGFGSATQKTKKQIRPNPASIVAPPKAARLHKLVEKIDVAPHQLQPRPRSHRTVHALWRPTDVYLSDTLAPTAMATHGSHGKWNDKGRGNREPGRPSRCDQERETTTTECCSTFSHIQRLRAAESFHKGVSFHS